MQHSERMQESYIYSVCQQCNTNCGIRVTIKHGHACKIEGNPYSPWPLTPHIPYATTVQQAAHMEGALCPKGYAGIQTLYDPYRIKKVLKRVGKRGEQQWQSIDFHQAIKEIVEGGNLFGEGHVQGLQDIATLKDPHIFAALAKDAALVASKSLPLKDFKEKHAEHLQHLIDPDHPDLGPKNNQICYSWGRQKGGRSELIQRFFGASLGTVNTHGHTTVCQGSLYFTCKAMSEQFDEGVFRGGKKFYWQADTRHARCIIFVGANPMEANYGPPLRASKINEQVTEGQQKIAVVDPRFSTTASRAWKWIPIHPHGVAALGMGMVRYILENHKYNADYLSNCNAAAARKTHEPTWSQGTWLVKIRPDGSPGDFLRASDLGQTKQPRQGKKGPWFFDAFVAMHKKTPIFFDPNDTEHAVQADLFVHEQVHGHTVKSVLQIYKEEAMGKSLKTWAEEAGTHEEELMELAREFTSHGRKAVVDIHRGVSQHSNGFYNVAIWMLVNTLMGNYDYTGGLSKATTFDTHGKGGSYDIHQGKNLVQPWGISLIRHGIHYEKTTLFKGFPAKRPWYPFASDIYQEIIPSAGDAYPYGIKALFLYMAAPTYSLPAGHTLMQILADSQKIPLIIASDCIVGETSMYADYIFPDVTYLERWEFPGSHPSQVCKVAPIRQPAVAPLTDTVTVFGKEQHLSLESLLLGIAEYMHLPGFGEKAFEEDIAAFNASEDATHEGHAVFKQNKAFTHQDDLYLRQVANIALGEKKDGLVPAANEAEIELFLQNRSHLPQSIFDPVRWKSIVGEALWPHVVTVLHRGGRFQEYAKAYAGEKLCNTYGKMVGMYFEHIGQARSSMTGKRHIPYAKAMDSPLDCLGKPLTDHEQGYTLHLITYKSITQCKSRTSGNYWLQSIHGENSIEVAAEDATRLGLRNGDSAKITSASNVAGLWPINTHMQKPMIGKVKVTQGLRPGVIAFSLGYGHWANGASHLTIDGLCIAGDALRATGVHANAAMCVDPVLKNTCLTDSVGASAVFCQSLVKLEKIK